LSKISKSNSKRKFFHSKRKPKADLPVVELEVTGVAFGGKGVARKDGKVFFVAGGLPGEKVLCQLEKDKKKFSEGYVTEYLEKSEARKKNICEYFGQCGGCQWLGVDYAEQLNWKKGFIENSLKRIAGMNQKEIEVISSPEELNYRSRIMIRVHVGSNGKATFGFFRIRSRELISISRCQIASEKINALLVKLKDFKSSEMANSKFRLEIQEIPSAEDLDNSLLVTATPAEGRDQNLDPIIEFLNSLAPVKLAGKSSETKDREPILFEKDLGVDFYVSPGQFYQINLENNKMLRRLVLDKVNELNPKVIYDVFCGSGNLSLPLSSVDEGENGKGEDRTIYGVELNPISIRNANISVENNKNLDNSLFTYEAMDASKYTKNMKSDGKNIDLIILDPPREGMPEGLEELSSLGAKDILYVSCDPVTLARDLEKLSSLGYEIVEYKALDFFPQTYHIESFVHLRVDC
jgi:23S rRNA (uracil1939-C5)-methyltransferase